VGINGKPRTKTPIGITMGGPLTAGSIDMMKTIANRPIADVPNISSKNANTDSANLHTSA
jgi:hypothetical protein